MTVAIIICAIGLIAAAVGGVWYLIVAFKEGPLWGIGVLVPFVSPVVSVIFLIKFWNDAWRPFALNFVGLIIAGVGAALLVPAMGERMVESAATAVYEDSYGENGYSDEYDEYADDEYGEDDEYGDDSYGEDDAYGDDTVVADGDDSGDGTDGATPRDPQVADTAAADSPGSPPPAVTPPSSPQRPTTPPSRLGGSFARRADDNAIPMELAADYIGQRIKITKNSGNVVYCRLLEVNDDNLVIHQSLGGGMVRFTLPKDSIQKIAKDIRR